jgi:hypothetical protein
VPIADIVHLRLRPLLSTVCAGTAIGA